MFNSHFFLFCGSVLNFRMTRVDSSFECLHLGSKAEVEINMLLMKITI